VDLIYVAVPIILGRRFNCKIPEDASDSVGTGGDDAVPVDAAYDVTGLQSRRISHAPWLDSAHRTRTSRREGQTVATMTCYRARPNVASP